MSSHRRQQGQVYSRRQALLLLGSATAALALAGCGFQPLYGPTPDGAPLQAVMASVEIGTVPGRVGQKVRNELIYGMTGGGHAADYRYRLEIAIRESLTDLLVERSGETNSQIYNLDAAFRLVRIADGSVAMQGSSVGRAAYDRYQAAFSNVRARIDAENRAAKTVAETIKTRVAAYLSGTA